MKIKNIFILCIFLCLMSILSCGKTKRKELIDGGNYKFWYRPNEDGEIVYSYFGSDGKYERFVKNEKIGFHRYGSAIYEDDLPPKKWLYKNDSIGLDSNFFKIVELNENRMIIEHENWLDTMYICHDGIIPTKFNHKW